MKKKLRIAIVVPHWRPARITGTELFNEIVVDILKNQHTVTVITSDSYATRYFRNIFSNNRIPSSLNIIRLKHHPVKAFLMYILRLFFPNNHGPYIEYKDISSTLRNNRYDYIYLSSLPHTINYQAVQAIKKQKLSTKIIIRPNYHGQIYKSGNLHYQYIFSHVDAVHVWTKAEKEELLRDYMIDENKIIVMHPPIKKQSKEKNSSAYLRNDKKIILYAGEKNKEKGIYTLIEAVKRLKKDDVQIIAIGSSDWKWRLYKLFHHLSLLNDLGYVGLNRKELLFQECNIFCLPSIADSFGFAYLDAWRYKKPVIAIRNEVMKELIEKNNAGILTSKGNAIELADAIKTLLNDPRLALKLGNNGYRILHTKYSYQKNKAHFLRLFLG